MCFTLCLSRYQYFLQLKNDIIDGRIPCTLDQAVLLASYSVQGNIRHAKTTFIQKMFENVSHAKVENVQTIKKHCKQSKKFLQNFHIYTPIWERFGFTMETCSMISLNKFKILKWCCVHRKYNVNFWLLPFFSKGQIFSALLYKVIYIGWNYKQFKFTFKATCMAYLSDISCGNRRLGYIIDNG